MANIFSLYGNIFIDNSKADKAIDDTTKKAKSFSSKMDDLGKSAGKLGKTLTTNLTLPIIGGMTLAVKGTEELRGDLAKLETNAEMAGVGIEATNDALKDLNTITGETDSNVEALSNLMQAGFNDSQMKEAVDALSGAVIKFPDTLKIEGLADGLQETLATGEAIGPFSELLERMGFDLDVFNNGLATAQANGTGTDYVLQTLADLGLAKVTEKFRETNKEMIESKDASFNLQMGLADLAQKIEPLITKLTESIAKLVGWFNGLDESGQNFIITSLLLVAALGPALLIFSKLITIIKGVGLAFTWLGAHPFALAILAIGAVVLAIVTLIKHFDTVKLVATAMSKTVANVFISMGNVIINIINGLIKNFLTPFNLIIKGINKLPGVKIPEIKIAIPKIPSFKTGLDYVPEDNFLANLHEGERVLTKQENKDYNEGKSGGTINNYFNIEKVEVRSDDDIPRIAEELFYMQQKAVI